MLTGGGLRFLGLIPVAFWAVLVASPAGGQSLTEARFVLRDIKRHLPGTYDNEPQIFVESAFGAGADGNHGWYHLNIEPLDGIDLGDAVFLVNTTERGGTEKPERWNLLAFAVDEGMRAVRMSNYDLPALAAQSGDARIMAAAARPVAGNCPVYWRQGPGHIYGAVQNAWCARPGAKPEQQLRSDWTLTEDELFVYQAVRAAGSGEFVQGRVDEVPLRFTKVKWYECFINITHRDGAGRTTINPFTMHDGGDIYTFQTDETPARTIDVLLRRSMWTSRSGNNFVPLLQIWVYADGNRAAPLASSWSDAGSGRVGWDAHHVGGGRCKIPTPPPFD
jgi:hypothetical protein